MKKIHDNDRYKINSQVAVKQSDLDHIRFLLDVLLGGFVKSFKGDSIMKIFTGEFHNYVNTIVFKNI